jgi:23S rRNA (uracil1939-C5)-methyltransferase
VTPERWGPRGEAVVGTPDRYLLVWQGIPGERARVRVEHRGQTESYGRWIAPADRPHPERVQPICEKLTSCGGCAMMHVSPKGQEQARRDIVRAELDAFGLGDVQVGAFHASPAGLRDYRHVVKVGVGHSDQGRIRVGAFGRGDRARIVPIPDCPVAAPVLRKVMDALAYHVIDLELHPYDPETDRGVLRYAVIRASHITGEVLLTLVAGRHVHQLQELAERVAQQCNEVVGVWLHLNQDEGNAILARDGDGAFGVKPLAGKATIEERLNDVPYLVGPGDFFQTNPAMAEVLYARTLEKLSLDESTPFVDLYCGVGGFALQAAPRTGWALGIEEVEGAVLRARDAARLSEAPCEFVAGQVVEVLPDVAKRLAGSRPVVTVNPARRGLEEGVVDAIVAIRPQRIAYVSCNPKAMARDLAAFREKGFVIGEVELFDMFPNTPHVEALVILESSEPVEETARRAPRRRLVR